MFTNFIYDSICLFHFQNGSMSAVFPIYLGYVSRTLRFCFLCSSNIFLRWYLDSNGLLFTLHGSQINISPTGGGDKC
jgi:hypothetical protein